jgi:nucleoside-triphosphatase
VVSSDAYEKNFICILDFWLVDDVKHLPKRIFLLTGAPGIGKTTVIIKTVEYLKEEGVSIGGMISKEARESNTRVGFEIIDLINGKHGWLAHINQKSGPQVGKYNINISDLENIGAKTIAEATEKCTVIAIDEIGPMELYSEKFKTAVKQALESRKPVLAVAHAKARDPLIMEAKQRKDAEFFVVTAANRDILPKQLTNKLLVLSK